MALPPIFIAFIGDYTGLKESADGVKKELAEVDAEGGASLESLGAVGKGVMLGMGVAMIGAGYESLKLATSFQSSMEQIHTQAGVPQAALQSLGTGVLQLAGQVGFSPDSLAESLYHVESSFASVGITGPAALNLLKIAAEGAAVGHANLVDVQNALDAAVASGIKGVQNYSQAMGALNAIVGSGDMQMQDLADALGTGVLAVVKGYGITLNDTGAALATFGDNNIRGSVAATDLRMAVQALSVPAKTADQDLKTMGMTTSTLADDMKTGGLSKALNDLSTRMKKAGLDGVNMGETITTMFGKKAGSGLAVLMSQLDRFNSKYPELEKGAGGFNDAVAANQQTLAQKMADAKAAVESLGTSMGEKLLPVVTTVFGYLSSGIAWLSGHNTVFYAMASGLGALAVAFGVVKIATIEWSATLLANPVVWIAAAIIALGAAIYYAYTHFKGFRDVVQAVGNALKAGFSDAMRLAGDAIKWFEAGPLVSIKKELAIFAAFWHSHGQEITQDAKAAWSMIKTIVVFDIKYTVDTVKAVLTNLLAIWKFVWNLVRNSVKMDWDMIRDTIKTGTKVFLDIVGLFLDVLHGKWGKLGSDAKKLVGDAISGVRKIFSDFGHDALGLLEQAGKDILNGLIKGIESGLSSVISTVKNVGSTITSAFHDVMGIFSPSRVMARSGSYVIAGLNNALLAGKGLLANTARSLGTSIMTGFGSPKLALGAAGMGTSFGPALGAGGLNSSGGTVIQNTVNINNQGSVLAQNDLRDEVQQAMLRLGGRNASTWAPARV